MTELAYLSAVELAKAVKAKEVSPSEVIDYFAKRIDERNPTINAFVYLKLECAMKEEKLLEKKLAKGEDVGPLAGVPFALKDFIPSKKGWQCSKGGVKAMIGADPVSSAFCNAMEKAGGIAIGKTNAPAFAFRGVCDNKLYGPTSTPFNTAFNSGGSSGGSAAAVADGLLPISEGTDGGGSTRIPAAWCNCVGYKASVGTIPSVVRPNGFTATHPICIDGAITRTVEDSAVVLNYMAGFDPRDPMSLDIGNVDFTEEMKKPIKGWKIGFTTDFDVFSVEKEVANVVTKAAERFIEAGAIVEPVHFNINRSQMELAEAWCGMICIDTVIEFEALKRAGIDLLKDHRNDLPEELMYWVEKVYKEDFVKYGYYDIVRTEILDAQQDVFDNYDLIVSPTTTCLPVKNADNRNTLGPEFVNGEAIERGIGFCETYFENFTGNPAISVPAGLSESGLPIGMQIIGKKYRDSDVFAAAGAFEQIQPWMENYKIPWKRKT